MTDDVLTTAPDSHPPLIDPGPAVPAAPQEMTAEQLAEARHYGRWQLGLDLTDSAVDLLYLGLFAFLAAVPLDAWLAERIPSALLRSDGAIRHHDGAARVRLVPAGVVLGLRDRASLRAEPADAGPMARAAREAILVGSRVRR